MQIASLARNSVSYQNLAVAEGTTYFYRVRAFKSGTYSAYSNTASATTPQTIPASPSALAATAVAANRVDVRWTDNSFNESGFRLERSLSSAGPFASAATLGPGVTLYSDLSVSENTTYFYRVVAFNTAGNSGFSNTGSARTPQTIPIAPGNLGATAASPSQINLTWSDNSSNESLFRIERSSTSIGPWVEITTVAANATGFSNIGLSQNTTYYYRVRAWNSAGNSVYTGVSGATTPATIPIAPSGLAATAPSSTQINLGWTDNSFNESGFRIERAATSAGPWSLIATTGAGATSYSNTGLNPSTIYFYRVQAFNTAGNSGYTNTASATTIAATPTPTSTPTRTPTSPAATATPTRTPTRTPTSPAATATPTRTPTRTPTSPAATATPTRTPTRTPTSPAATPTPTRTPTRTPTSPAATATPTRTPTRTPTSPAATATPTRTPTRTPTSPAATATPTRTPTRTPTSPAATATPTRTPTRTPTSPAATATPTRTPTRTPTSPSATATPTRTPTSAAATATPTRTPTVLAPTATPTRTPTQTVAPSGGTEVWSTNFGGPMVGVDVATPSGMVIDRSGASIVVGYLKGKADFGGGYLTSAGNGDIYLVKYASDGSYLWSQRFGAAGDDRAKGIAIDAADNIVITGLFRETVTFGGTALVAAPFTANAFVAKYSPGGTHLWSRRLASGVNTDTGNTVAIDGPGNVYVGGSLFGTSDFGGGPLVSAGGEDIFLAKYASNGAYFWARRFGGSSADSVVDIAADQVTGEVAMTGYFTGYADFGSGVFVASAGANDAFVAKYSSTGAHLWSGPWGNTGDDRGASIAFDNLGNVIVTGLCTFSVNFGGGPLPSQGDGASGDIFLVKLSPNGVHLGSRSFGSSLSLNEMSSGVSSDTAGNILLTGSNVGTVNYGGGALSGDGWYNIFVAKFDSNMSHVWSKRYTHGGGNANGRAVAAGANDNVLASGDYDVSVNFGGATLTSPGAADTFLVKLSR